MSDGTTSLAVQEQIPYNHAEGGAQIRGNFPETDVNLPNIPEILWWPVSKKTGDSSQNRGFPTDLNMHSLVSVDG